ncbi:hypothetical protein Ddc_04926 [Ditylenchus destructor]|nr:hypothetical protein Ddc_04926 [Ditylenchus destructor]
MSESVEPSPVVVVTQNGVAGGAIVDTKVDEIQENHLGLDALKCAIEAIGDAMAELAETSAAGSDVNTTNENAEVNNEEVTNNTTAQPSESVTVISHEVNVETNESTEAPQADQIDESTKSDGPVSEEPTTTDSKPEGTPNVEEVTNEAEVIAEPQESVAVQSSAEETPVVATETPKEEVENVEQSQTVNTAEVVPSETTEQTETKFGDVTCETGFETTRCEASMNKQEEDSATQTSGADLVAIKIEENNEAVPLAQSEPEQAGDIHSIDADYEEIEIEEEIEGSEHSLVALSLEVKVTDFTVHEIVQNKCDSAAGHGVKAGAVGVVDGTKAGAKAIANTTGKVVDGTKELAHSAANSVKEGAKAGGEFVVETSEKIAEGSKAAAVGAAHGALYGVGAVIGGTKAGVGMIADGTVKMAEGTRDTATSFVKAGAGAVGDIVDATKSGAGAVVDGTKSGAKFVATTTGNAVNKVEEELRQMAIAAVSAANDGAQYAGYGKQPGQKAIELPRSEEEKPKN